MAETAKKGLHKKEADYYYEHLKRLAGGRIIAAGSNLDEEDEWSGGVYPMIQVAVKTKEGLKVYDVEMSRDGERNGPGHPHIYDAEPVRPAEKGTMCNWDGRGMCKQPAVEERVSILRGWVPLCKRHSELWQKVHGDGK